MHEQVVTLRGEVDALRTQLDEAQNSPINAASYLKRVQDERDEVLKEVKELREAMGVVAPGKEGPTVISRLKAQLAAERAENRNGSGEHSAQIAALRAERDAARAKLSDQGSHIRHLKSRLAFGAGRAEQESAERDEASPEPEVAPNREAYVQRIQEERDELRVEVRGLRDAAADARSGASGPASSPAAILTRLAKLLRR